MSDPNHEKTTDLDTPNDYIRGFTGPSEIRDPEPDDEPKTGYPKMSEPAIEK